MEVQQQPTPKITPLISGKAPESLKRCPKCASFFLSDTSCESCGYQLAYDGLGAPMGERSYYALMENYHNEWPLLYRLFPKMGQGNLKLSLKKPKRYPKETRLLFRLAQRFSKISEYFLTSDARDLAERKLYLIEWRSLCLDLIDFYGEAWVSSKLDELIDESTKATKVNLLMGFYSRALEEYRLRPKDHDRKWFGPKAVNYMGALLLVGIASVSALALMKYYTIVGR